MTRLADNDSRVHAAPLRPFSGARRWRALNCPNWRPSISATDPCSTAACSSGRCELPAWPTMANKPWTSDIGFLPRRQWMRRRRLAANGPPPGGRRAPDSSRWNWKKPWRPTVNRRPCELFYFFWQWMDGFGVTRTVPPRAGANGPGIWSAKTAHPICPREPGGPERMDTRWPGLRRDAFHLAAAPAIAEGKEFELAGRILGSQSWPDRAKAAMIRRLWQQSRSPWRTDES